MNDDFVAELDLLLAYFRKEWDEKRAPSDANIGRARRLINAADRLVTPSSEKTQRKLDALYGYFVWGRVMLSVAMVNPIYIGYERRDLPPNRRAPTE